MENLELKIEIANAHRMIHTAEAIIWVDNMEAHLTERGKDLRERELPSKKAFKKAYKMRILKHKALKYLLKASAADLCLKVKDDHYPAVYLPRITPSWYHMETDWPSNITFTDVEETKTNCEKITDLAQQDYNQYTQCLSIKEAIKTLKALGKNRISEKDFADFIKDAKAGIWSDGLIDLGFHGVDTATGVITTDTRILDAGPPKMDKNGFDYAGIWWQVERIASVFSKHTPHKDGQDHDNFEFSTWDE